MPDLNGDTAELITAGVLGLGTLGGGVKWFFARREARQKMVDDAVAEAFAGLRKELKETKAQVAVLSNIYFKLSGELARHLPDSPVLREVHHLFGLAFATPEGLPDAMADLLDTMHHDETKGRPE